MCICTYIHTYVFTLKINWLIVRGNIPPLNQLNSDNWLPQLGFNHQTLRFHASFCSRIYLSALLEVCWSHPGGCNDVCGGHFICWPSADSRERTPGCPVPCDVTRTRGFVTVTQGHSLCSRWNCSQWPRNQAWRRGEVANSRTKRALLAWPNLLCA